MAENTRVNLLDFDYQAMAAFCQAHGQPPFRAQQLLKWIHRDGVTDFNLMTNLSKAFRATLNEIACIRLPEIQWHTIARDGTQKWLIKLNCGNCIETVFIPSPTRGTVCISSQVGCGLNCTFCATARQGFNRNLTVGEIIGQLWLVVRSFNTQHDRTVTNVVMMGMGEPLLNLDNVISAMNIMLDDHAYSLSKERVTLSTSGLVPEMLILKERSPVALAVSLHAPSDALRDQLVPLNKKYSLDKLIAVCRDYFPAGSRRKVMFEYVMLKGVNDQLKHAEQLARLLQGIPCKVNLIPFNPFSGVQYERSTDEQIALFQQALLKAGIRTTRRQTRGQDEDAACGMLVGQVMDRTKRSQKFRAESAVTAITVAEA